MAFSAKMLLQLTVFQGWLFNGSSMAAFVYYEEIHSRYSHVAQLLNVYCGWCQCPREGVRLVARVEADIVPQHPLHRPIGKYNEGSLASGSQNHLVGISLLHGRNMKSWVHYQRKLLQALIKGIFLDWLLSSVIQVS